MPRQFLHTHLKSSGRAQVEVSECPVEHRNSTRIYLLSATFLPYHHPLKSWTSASYQRHTKGQEGTTGCMLCRNSKSTLTRHFRPILAPVPYQLRAVHQIRARAPLLAAPTSLIPRRTLHTSLNRMSEQVVRPDAPVIPADQVNPPAASEAIPAPAQTEGEAVDGEKKPSKKGGTSITACG